MFYKYLISNLNNEEILYLFLENNYEFSNDFSLSDKNNTNIQANIKKYLDSNNIKFYKGKIFLVVNGLILGSVDFSNNHFSTLNKYLDVDKISPIQENEEIEIIDVTPFEVPQNIIVKSNNSILKTTMKSYLESALFNTTPLTYEKEAMKAITIIIRTNCLKDINKYGYVNDENNYLTKGISTLEKSSRYGHLMDKLNEIVNETNNIFLTFKEKIVYLPQKSSNTYNYSMNLMAKEGYNCVDILKYFYPNTQIQNI
ncbi:MAG: SpoIID/LytB domain-containing protein [Bacilli bacterium]